MEDTVTPEVVVRHQLVHLRPQLAKMSREVSLLGHAPIPELQVAVLILQQRRKLSWIIQYHHAISPEHVSVVLHYTPAAVDVTEVHPIPVTHECGNVPEHTEICPASEGASIVVIVCPCKQNGQNRGTEKDIRIQICRREAHGMIQNKMVQSGTGEHQEGMKELA
jgi:hypothetical protein